MADEAHASGVLGKDGRGSVSHFGLEGRVAIQVGTLSKAVGVTGGYVAGSQALRDILIQRARPFLFSTSQPPAVAAACRAAIRILVDEPELIERLWANTRRFKAEPRPARLRHRHSETPITPVMLGDPRRPSGSPGGCSRGRVRDVGRVPDGRHRQGADPTIVTAAHTDEMLDTAVAAFDRVGRELGVIAG
jgi:glycine C-acetyltransferase